MKVDHGIPSEECLNGTCDCAGKPAVLVESTRFDASLMRALALIAAALYSRHGSEDDVLSLADRWGKYIKDGSRI
jgi:hypothetical protein